MMKRLLSLFSTAGLLLVACMAVNAQPVAISANSNTMVARAPDSRGWTDPALNHNRLLREQLGEGAYKLIGTYKVKGSPFLFGGKHNADIFTPKEKAYNIDIAYNTYNQEIEFYSTSNPSTPLMKEPGEVDSFILKKDENSSISSDLTFIYGPLLGFSEKAYLQVVEPGQRYSLYKRYKSDLGFVSDNYIQSELRQFDLVSEYFYYDAETKKLKKMKFNFNNVIRELKGIKDVTPVADKDLFATDPEGVMKKIFAYLNS